MARKSNVARDKKREKLVEQYSEKRSTLKGNADYEGLSKLPRNASRTRIKNRCRLCGRPNSYMKRFQMCRICFRKLASNGDIMGIKKSSW